MRFIFSIISLMFAGVVAHYWTGDDALGGIVVFATAFFWYGFLREAWDFWRERSQGT